MEKEKTRTGNLIDLIYAEMKKEDWLFGLRNIASEDYDEKKKEWTISMEEDTSDGSDGGSFWEHYRRIGSIKDHGDVVIAKCSEYNTSFKKAAKSFKEKYGTLIVVEEVESKWKLY